MTDEDKKINEALLSWLSMPEAKFYEEQLEDTKTALVKQLELAKEDHRYIQGRLSLCKEMLAFKDVLRTYLDENA